MKVETSVSHTLFCIQYILQTCHHLSTVAEAFYWGELENELRESGLVFAFRKDEYCETCVLLLEERGEYHCILISALMTARREV